MAACTCTTDYYNARSAIGEVECVPCPAGSECNGDGATLASLPLLDGYYRTSSLSNDPRECPAYGGVTGEARCRAASSGGNGTCVGNLTGSTARPARRITT